VSPILSIENLTTSFVVKGRRAIALRGVSFAIDEGESIALVGESGSGKSVTALSVLGLLPANARVESGSITFEGAELLGATKDRLRRVRGRRLAIVFQDSTTSLNPVLTVGKQLGESIETHLRLFGRDATRRAVTLLEDVGVTEAATRLRQYPHQLSGGLRQRAAIAIALAGDPSLLIADEPTTALDVTTQAQVLDVLRRERTRRGMALLLITHDLGIVAGLTDRTLVMYGGRIVESGETRELFAAPRHPYTHALVTSIPRLDSPTMSRLPTIPGAPPAIWDIPEGCAFAPRCSAAIDICRTTEPSLEEIVVDHRAACWRPRRDTA
jgi:oligopeptide/dipeptide ABC transporter ATP-binding protein